METLALKKVCPKCGLPGDFHKHKKAKDGLQSWCKECNKQQARENPNTSISKRKFTLKLQDFIFSYLQTHPCVDCGETDILVLDFDHVRGEKLFNISSAAASGRPLADIQAEIEKCDVRCANDHRRRTASQFGHSKIAWLQKRSN
jgi:hypothetical protein